ncbi:MAG TPA: hypothetical protein VGX23_07990 [Actinocrinis sp.]|nr:hypothetical protein [Actinocrinis sp.]
MVKSVFWVAVGAAAGILVVTKVSKTLKKLAPSSLADQASGVPGRITGAWSDLTEDIRSAAAEREFELYRALGVDVPEDDHS